jgi:ParB-like chromosome segregation protein Spo0J
MTCTDTHLLLRYTQLKRWPANLRKNYDPEAVTRMAVSQAERVARGQPACIHELVITTRPGHHYESKRDESFFIVAGHLRHAGNAHLGKDAPLLNCVVRYYATGADMLADMRTENGQRVNLSPLEWADHFSQAIAAGVPEHLLLKQSGQTSNFFQNCLILAKLSKPVQAIIDSGDLSIGAAKHLLEIENDKLQLQLARRLRGRTIAEVEHAVGLVFKRKDIPRKKTRPAPSAQRHLGVSKAAPQRPATDNLPAYVPSNATSLRAAAKHACAICNIGRQLPLPEPAWRSNLRWL